jgi:tetratricopeptide (TPR) repeat protein
MILAIYLLSVFFFIVGWLYYSSPEKARKINSFFNDKIFNEKYIILKRKKISSFFLFLGFICSMIAFADAIYEERHDKRSDEITQAIYFDALGAYEKILEKNPDDQVVLVKCGHILESFGKASEARNVWKKLLSLNPENKTVKEKLDESKRLF